MTLANEAEVAGQLECLGTRHDLIKGVDAVPPLLGDPLLLVDHLLLHHVDLCSGSAEGSHAEGKELGKESQVRDIRGMLRLLDLVNRCLKIDYHNT